MKTNRRAFLKFMIGTVALATIPIPRFLTPKPNLNDLNRLLEYGKFGGSTRYDAKGSTLTVEMIEHAAERSLANMGKPDMIMMSERDYKTLEKHYGFKIVYVD